MSNDDELLEKADEALSDMLSAGVEEFTTEGGKHNKLIPLEQLLDAQDRLERRKARKSRSVFQVVRRIDG